MSWKQVSQQIVDGLRQTHGSAARDVALLRLARMAAICDYFRSQEEHGSDGWAESALHPEKLDSVSTL